MKLTRTYQTLKNSIYTPQTITVGDHEFKVYKLTGTTRHHFVVVDSKNMVSSNYQYDDIPCVVEVSFSLGWPVLPRVIEGEHNLDSCIYDQLLRSLHVFLVDMGY